MENKQQGIQSIYIIIISVLLSLICSVVFCNYYITNKLSKKTNLTSNTQTSQGQENVVNNTTNNISIKTGELESSNYSSNSLAETIGKIKDSVVEINATTAVGKSAGSGIITGEDTANGCSYILTNHHVIEGANEIKIIFTDKSIISATLVGADPDEDIAVLKVLKTGLNVATFGNSDEIVLGEDVIVIGNPLGSLGGTVSTGIVSCTSREINVSGTTMTLIQTDSAINSGNSGGGMFNSSGLLIGVVNAKASALGVEGLGFAIPSNKAKEAMVGLLSTASSTTYGYIEGKTKLGVSFKTTLYGNIFSYTQVVVLGDVDECGSAYEAGIRENDILVSVKIGENTLDVDNNVADIENFVKSANLKIGDKITFTIKKSISGETSDVEVTMKQYIYHP